MPKSPPSLPKPSESLPKPVPTQQGIAQITPKPLNPNAEVKPVQTFGPPGIDPGKFNDPFEALDGLLIKHDAGPAPKKVVPEPKPDEPPKGKEPTPEPPKPEPGKTEAVSTPPPDRKPEKIEELRTAYETAKKRISELEGFSAKAKEYETLEKTLDETRQRLVEAENELRAARYESTPEYKEKYQQPFEEAYASARSKIGQMEIEGEDGETRNARPEDFDRLMRAGNENEAIRLAQELFGDRAPFAMMHREKVLEMSQRRWKAIESHRREQSQISEKKALEEKENQKRTVEYWDRINREVAEKNPEIFGPRENDEQANSLLQEGYQIADLAIAGGTPEMTHVERLDLISAMRNRCAAFGRLMHERKAMKSKIADLESKLAEYQASTPGAGSPGSPAAAPDNSWEAQLERRAKR